MASDFNFRRRQVLAWALENTRKGADVTLTDAVRAAKPLTPVVTGTLQGSLMAEGATVQGQKVVGRWGSFDVNYALVVEMREFMLRRAADSEYPKFRQNIERFSKGG